MATNVSSVTSHFPDAENGFTTTTSGSVSSGATTVGLNSTAGYTNGEPVVFVIDPANSKKQTFTGIIDTSGNQVTGVVWTAGTNVAHDAGATVVDYATATHIAMMSKGIKVEHAQDGTHKSQLISSRTEDTSPASGDFLLTSDVSDSNNLKKVTVSNLFANIPDGSVTPADLVSGTGTSWAWQSWTPTWTNLTVGNGTNTSVYLQVGKTVFFRLSFVLGSTSSVGTNPVATIPITSKNYDLLFIYAHGNYVDVSAGNDNFPAFATYGSTTEMNLYAQGVSGSNVRLQGLTSTVPFTWATGDKIGLQGFYEAA